MSELTEEQIGYVLSKKVIRMSRTPIYKQYNRCIYIGYDESVHNVMIVGDYKDKCHYAFKLERCYVVLLNKNKMEYVDESRLFTKEMISKYLEDFVPNIKETLISKFTNYIPIEYN